MKKNMIIRLTVIFLVVLSIVFFSTLHFLAMAATIALVVVIVWASRGVAGVVTNDPESDALEYDEPLGL